MNAQRKKPPLTDGLSKTTPAHNITALAYVKLEPSSLLYGAYALGLRHE